jgi:hypothetical protein
MSSSVFHESGVPYASKQSGQRWSAGACLYMASRSIVNDCDWILALASRLVATGLDTVARPIARAEP